MIVNPATSIVSLPYLSVEECDAVLRDLDEDSFKPGAVGVADEASGQYIRRCTVCDRIDPGLTERLVGDLLRINEEHFRFRIEGLRADDPVTVMRYGPGDHFLWHLDNGVVAEPVGSRKLSFTIQLSGPDEYEGGDLEFALYHEAYGGRAFAADREATRQAGQLILFPAFHVHRVAPVTRGRRHALVGWLHGPTFR